jgi:phage gpG-like protein
MARISFSISAGGVAEVDRFFDVLEGRVEDLRGAWPATDAVFHDILRQQFESEGGHGGRPWRALKDVTVAMRQHRYGYYEAEPAGGVGPAHPILRWTGSLMESLINRDHALAISEHSRLRYVRGSQHPGAAAHQTGSKDGRLPQRPIIFLNERDRHRLMRPVRNWVTGHDPWAEVPLAEQLGLNV